MTPETEVAGDAAEGRQDVLRMCQLKRRTVAVIVMPPAPAVPRLPSPFGCGRSCGWMVKVVALLEILSRCHVSPGR